MKRLIFLITFVSFLTSLPALAEENAKKPTFSAEVSKVVKAIRKNIWGDKKAMYTEQTIKATIPFAGEQTMKTRAWNDTKILEAKATVKR